MAIGPCAEDWSLAAFFSADVDSLSGFPVYHYVFLCLKTYFVASCSLFGLFPNLVIESGSVA